MEEQTTVVSEEAPSKVIRTTRTNSTPIEGEHPQKIYERKKTIFRTYQIIWYVLGLIEVILVFRVVLRMLGANVGSPFVNLIYTLSAPFALPFAGIFKTMEITGQAYFEWSTIVAMVVYLILAYGIIHLLQIMKPTTPREIEQKV